MRCNEESFRTRALSCLNLYTLKVALGEGSLLGYDFVIPYEVYQRPYDKRKIKGDDNGKISKSHSGETKWNDNMLSMWRQ